MITGLYGILPLLNWFLGERNLFDFHQVVLLPLPYVIGFVPALIVGCFDAGLAQRNVRWRVAWTMLFASPACFIPLMTSIIMGFIGGPFMLLFGIVGAIPAALCSWIANKIEKKALPAPMR